MTAITRCQTTNAAAKRGPVVIRIRPARQRSATFRVRDLSPDDGNHALPDHKRCGKARAGRDPHPTCAAKVGDLSGPGPFVYSRRVRIFLSPHLDDIALSCAGHLAQLTRGGEQVTIATVCTADTPVDVALSDSARHVHWEWQLGDDNPYGKRRLEDLAVCSRLGASALHLGFRDAVYRYDATGQPMYVTNFIGGAVTDHDWRTLYFALAARLRVVCADASAIYCPLAIGGHVDHVLVRSAAELALPGRLTYYEDYPYAQKVGQGDPGVRAELARITLGLSPCVVALSADDVAARIEAIGLYPSQQFALFEDAATMPAKVRDYVTQAGGERYWTSH
jgi:LmbE family N-acetylglucosaminyl deacetylase